LSPGFPTLVRFGPVAPLRQRFGRRTAGGGVAKGIVEFVAGKLAVRLMRGLVIAGGGVGTFEGRQVNTARLQPLLQFGPVAAQKLKIASMQERLGLNAIVAPAQFQRELG